MQWQALKGKVVVARDTLHGRSCCERCRRWVAAGLLAMGRATLELKAGSMREMRSPYQPPRADQPPHSHPHSVGVRSPPTCL